MTQNDTLLAAVISGNLDKARTALETGANVNARDTLNDTPLHHAARRGDERMVALLLESDAHVRATNNAGRRPVDLARENHHHAIVLALETPREERYRPTRRAPEPPREPEERFSDRVVSRPGDDTGPVR